MRGEIISVGTEILRGEVIDTNSPYLASQLLSLGIEVKGFATVGDNKEDLAKVIRDALERCEIVVLTGGLGPTEGDLTREAIAEVLGEELRINPDLEGWLRGLFASRGMEMPPRNIKQAMVIPSARPLLNPLGTAPGWWIEKEGRIIVALPGPPREMEEVWKREVLPLLQSKFGAIKVRTIKSFGLPEAKVDEILTPLLFSKNPSIGIYAKPDGIYVSISARGETEEEAKRMIEEMEGKVKSLLGEERIWGVDEDTLEGLIGRMLKEKGLTLAVMESCTGGLLADTITNIPGSSQYFKGGIVAYTNEMKVAFGVKEDLIRLFGAISPQVAEAMASAVRERFGADIGIGITGVAGPGEIEGKHVGVIYISIDALGRHFTFSPFYPFERLRIKRMAVSAALFYLKKILETLIKP